MATFYPKIIESGNYSKRLFSKNLKSFCDNESNLSDKFAELFKAKIQGIRKML